MSAWVVVVVAVVALGGCAGGVESAAGVIDRLEEAGVVDCTERREPFPDLITCEDDRAGDLTVVLTDTELESVQATAASADGPWVVGDGIVVVVYTGGVEQAEAVREVLGAGELWTVDGEGEPAPLGG